MQTITVKTGFGYFRFATGHIVSKSRLPPGDHPMREGYTHHEVADAAALALIQIWQDPGDTERQANEGKIGSRIRQIAVADLKGKGELPEDYE